MEFGNRQGAFVQQRVGVDTGRKDAFGHKAIHEFAALVVTHIDNDMAVLVDHTFGIFVLETAQSGALFRGGVRITRIDLDHITGAVRLLRVLGNVKTLIDLCPAVTPVLGVDAIAFQFRRKARHFRHWRRSNR